MVSSIVRGVDFSADVAKRAPSPLVVVRRRAGDELKGETRLSGGIVRFDLDLSGGVDNVGGLARFGRGVDR